MPPSPTAQYEAPYLLPTRPGKRGRDANDDGRACKRRTLNPGAASVSSLSPPSPSPPPATVEGPNFNSSTADRSNASSGGPDSKVPLTCCPSFPAIANAPSLPVATSAVVSLPFPSTILADGPHTSSEPTGAPPEATTPSLGYARPGTSGSDADSACSVGSTGETESVTSSIRNYVHEHGRRYHSDEFSSYWGPNDEQQQDAEDYFHYMTQAILGNEFYGSKDNLQNVLDVGTGTGIWAADFADENPSAVVIGTDISAIQPSWVSSNCRFEIDDFNEPWTFRDFGRLFDFVHSRQLIGCVRNWPAFLGEVFDSLAPGGEYRDIELPPYPQLSGGTLEDSPTLRLWQELVAYGEKVGKPFGRDKTPLEDVGFVNTKEIKYTVPIGTWSGDEEQRIWGCWNSEYLLGGIEGLALRALAAKGWDDAKIQGFLMEVCEEWESKHLYFVLYVRSGKKPPLPVSGTSP